MLVARCHTSSRRVAEAPPVVFPYHVRTPERLVIFFGLEAPRERLPGFHPLEPKAIAAAIGSILDGDRPSGKEPPL